MRVILFGATGMVGQGVLRECLLDDRVEAVLSIGRRRLAHPDRKLKQLVLDDLFNYDAVEDELRGYDACLFCLGTSVGDSDETEYVRLNHDLPLAAARALSKVNPAMTFIYVSGRGTDSTERGRVMWARVKGKTENALLKLGLGAVYLLRPGFIVPLNGEVSHTKMYRVFYRLFGWVLRAAQDLFPGMIADTEQVGRAMLQLARHGNNTAIIDSVTIHRLARSGDR